MKTNIKYIYFSILIAVQLYGNNVLAQTDNDFPIRITCGGGTFEGARLNLEAGTYELSIKVLIESGSFLRGFRSIIMADSWETLNWEFDNVAKDEWVTMTQEFTINTPIVDSRFRIHMLEDDVFGVGEGNFYLDDITLVQTSSLSVEVFPNPANTHVNILCPEGSDIIIYNILGVAVKSAKDIPEYYTFPISNLATGVYVMKVFSDGKVGTKKIIVR